jgi:O-antigen ligase
MSLTTFLIARKRLAIAVAVASTFVGVIAALMNVRPNPNSLHISVATTHVLLDTPPPSITQRRVPPQAVDGLTKRGQLYVDIIASPPVLERVAKRMGIATNRLGAVSRVTGDLPHALTEPDSEKRASEIRNSRYPYRLEVQARPDAPIIDIYSQAPTTRAAERLGDAAVASMRHYLSNLAASQGFSNPEPVRLRQLEPARGGVVNSMAGPVIAVLSFVVFFAIACAALLFVIRRHIRGRYGVSASAKTPRAPAAVDDWPHTKRLLPWMFALFLVVLWLMPFDEIELAFSTPIDLKLDRLVLPFVALVWVIALAAGGAMAPRLRLTKIHLAVGIFVACAFLSVVLDARYLNGTLEIDQSLKRLPLLLAYVSLFFVAASSVRRNEVRAFMTYTLVLAVICAVGVVWEYRFEVNLFYSLSDTLLPGFFSVGVSDASGIDAIGRRVVRGPAAVPLETVAMLTMALPIGLVFCMQAKKWRQRIYYGLAVCLVLAATLATFRKTGLLAPLSVGATLMFFRRRELLKLAPLGLVLIVVVHILSPGALGATSSQLEANRLGVPTVSDRAIDYDAVRPDVWTHLMFGRGWGTYNLVDYRTLDSEILQRLIEMGVVGLIAFLAMGVAVVAVARRTIAERDPQWAPLALIGAAVAVAFIVASTLFDILSFPHATYIFLYMAGLVAVVVGGASDASPCPSSRSGPLRPPTAQVLHAE